MKLTRKNSYKLKNRILHIFTKAKKYYSQCGEDVIMYSYLCVLKQKTDIFYVDLGAGDPELHSNTFLFYKKGFRGVCVDANKKFARRYKRKRKRDIFLNFVISDKIADRRKFYEFDMDTVSTIETNNVKYLLENGFKIKSVKEIQCITINEILEKASKIHDVNLLSIDIEGNEFQILKNIDFKKYSIQVICVEVVDFNTGQNIEGVGEIIKFMEEKEYVLLFNTAVNLIFIRKDI